MTPGVPDHGALHTGEWPDLDRADAGLLELRYGMERALTESNDEHHKRERYCREQRTVLRALEDLTTREHRRYKLNNDKDQVMTVCKVALVNLGMWALGTIIPCERSQTILPHGRVPIGYLAGTASRAAVVRWCGRPDAAAWLLDARRSRS